MDRADIAVLLVSVDFLNSDFIREFEVPRLLERHKKGQTRIFPIIVSHCAWVTVGWLQSLQCRPEGGNPLSDFEDSAVDQQLAKVAVEIAKLLADNEAETAETAPAGDPNKPSDVSELLELLTRSNVAKAPEDIEQAISKSLADVDRTLAKLGGASRRLELDDVNHVTSVAIGHGAGIYNHSHKGRVGCGRIYHRAASGLVELVPRVVQRSSEQPAIGVDLAIQWLSRIVEGSPLVRDETADDLAWELRFAFDSLRCIPQFDELHEALASASHSGNALPLVNSILQKAIEHSQKMAELHVAPYFLRHTAEVLVWLIQSDQLSGRNLTSVADELAPVVAEHPRIDRHNLAELTASLRDQLENAQRAIKAAASAPSGNGQRWFNPAQWFGRK
jgi:hypothetical protein